MAVNPVLIGVLGLAVFGLGLLIKQYHWQLEGRRMTWTIIGISFVFGIAQVVIEAQTSPFPPMPSDLVQIVFVWVPGLLAWVVFSATMVFAASQTIYSFIVKGLVKPQVQLRR